ncbi:serine hydrolase domain-containing protein [Streptomyces sp. NPDC048411]|uniref:serine hydrolase domain-containing protein n=1 Tax=Streptomyces sp. NPDC048411 TaxID=3157206 RepID=UPI0034554A03
MAALVVGTLVPTAGSVVAAPAGAAPDRVELQAALDRVVATGAVCAVAEVRQGSAVWRGTSGTATMNSRRPTPVNGRFCAGSVTQTFTATVVLQLVGEGRLRLSDTVQQWLPGVITLSWTDWGADASPAAFALITAALCPASPHEE